MAKYSYHRIDANHQEIREALEAVGATCDVRCPADLLVGFRGETFLLEVKTAKGKERPKQIKFRKGWTGQYAIVRSVSEALQVIGVRAHHERSRADYLTCSRSEMQTRQAR